MTAVEAKETGDASVQEKKFELTVRTPIIHWIAPNRKGNWISSIFIDDDNGFCIAGQCSGTINCWKIPIATASTNKSNNNNNQESENTNKNKKKSKRPKESNLESPMYTNMQLSISNNKDHDINDGTSNGTSNGSDNEKDDRISDISGITLATNESHARQEAPSSPDSTSKLTFNVNHNNDNNNNNNNSNKNNSNNNKPKSPTLSFSRSPPMPVRTNKKRQIKRLITSKYNTFECLNIHEHDTEHVRHLWSNGYVIIALMGFRKLLTFEFKDIQSKKFVYNKEKCHENYIDVRLNRFFSLDISKNFRKYFSILTNDNCIKIFASPNIHKHINIDLQTSSMTNELLSRNYNLESDDCNIVDVNNNCVVIESNPAYSEQEFKKEEARIERQNRHRRAKIQARTYNTKYKRISIYSLNKNDDFQCLNTNQLYRNFDSNSNWGFQIYKNTMAYVDKHNIIRVVDFTNDSNNNHESSSNSTNDENKNNDNNGTKTENEAKINATRKLLHSYSTHSGYILAYQFRDGLVVSLGSDRKLCVWKNGQCLGVATNIPGTFIPGYPYIVTKSKKHWNQIFYTADDGIFMVEF